MVLSPSGIWNKVFHFLLDNWIFTWCRKYNCWWKDGQAICTSVAIRNASHIQTFQELINCLGSGGDAATSSQFVNGCKVFHLNNRRIKWQPLARVYAAEMVLIQFQNELPEDLCWDFFLINRTLHCKYQQGKPPLCNSALEKLIVFLVSSNPRMGMCDVW